MKRVDNLYKDIANFYSIYDMTNNVCTSVRNKKKVDKFETFKMEHVYHIYNKLYKKDFTVGKYNIFMISDPKCRIVMAQDIEDKIINHLVSKYALKCVFESKYTNSMCATRIGYGTLYGIKQLKIYLNKMKCKYNNFYILKLDISKYFYKIDHDILKSLIKEKIKDKNSLLLLDSIIDSTNSNYINKKIYELKNNRIDYLKKCTINNKNKLIDEVESIPLYEYGKGVALGNETSQAFGLIYLYKLNHYLKENLHLKYVINYMDDFVIIHQDKEYLKRCLAIIINILKEDYKLDINKNKTRIDSIKNGIDFLGYRFFIRNNRTIMKLRNKTKKKYKRKIKKVRILYRNNQINENDFLIRLNSYNGILKWGSCGSLFYKKEVIIIIEKYYKYKSDYKDYVIFIKSGNFYECLSNDALIINNLLNYKVKRIGNTLKVGFPINNISVVTSLLVNNNISYIVVDKDIIDKYDSNSNNYNCYYYDMEKILFNYIRIDKIIKYLEYNVLSNNMNDILNRIDEILKSYV